ncbi:MAG TPA: HAD family hydrolase [Streptosporangiaceae bacterium]|nr:HAD family hydrolase [Streptosporangiaceae bacterium]
MSDRRHPVVLLDVGGVIYYDEPFDLAWVKLVWERARAADPGFTLDRVLDHMERFYERRGAGPGNVFLSPLARESWLAVQGRWLELAQPIPGAVEGVRRLAEHRAVCVVANQPPQCAEVLAALGLDDRLRLIALDSLVGFAKPDLRLLTWALEHLASPPTDALVAGNRVDHDVIPARACGCAVAFVLPDHRWRPPVWVDPPIVDAYRRLRSVPPLPAAGETEYVIDGVSHLADLLTEEDGWPGAQMA